MLDFAALSPDQRSTVDVGDKVETYQGFMRALRYVVVAHLAIGIGLALIFFFDADIGTAAVVGLFLLVVGFGALMRRSSAPPRDIESKRAVRARR
jgi:hypothetical protein